MIDHAREWLETIHRTTGNTKGADWAKDSLERLDAADDLEASHASEIAALESEHDDEMSVKTERIAELEKEKETADREASEAWEAAKVSSHEELMEFLRALNS